MNLYMLGSRLITNLLIVATIYRPPETTLENDKFLYDEIEIIVNTKTSIICRNLNLPHINWTVFTSGNEGSRLMRLMKKKPYPKL